jgi:cobalt-zinc-cadmium efflux system outer membrane protein
VSLQQRFRRRIFPLAAVICVAALAHCAAYRPRPLDPARTAATLLQRSLSDPRLLRFIAIAKRQQGPPRWDLDTLTLVALYERPDMPLAAAALQAAAAAEITAAALPNPVVSLQPTYNATVVRPSPWKDVGPVVTFLINSLAERPQRIAEARARTRAARQILAITAWKLRGAVRTALIDVWASRQRVGLAARALALARDYRRVVAQRYRAGLISAARLVDAELAENRAALELAADERAARLARAELATALAVPEKALRGIRLDLAEFSHPRRPSELAPLIREALTARPDLAAALARYAAAEAALRLAVLRQYPALDIGPGYHYDQGSNEFILALSLPLPVFNQNQGPIAQARAARRLAAGEFLAVQTRVLDEIERARAAWRASQPEQREARRLRAAARRTLARRRADFAAGLIGRLRLIGAEQALIQAEQGTLAAAVDERRALGELEAALYHRFL